MFNPEILIVDVDGVLTPGNFYYSENGKIIKSFGADDSDALKLISDYIKVIFVSGDKRGFSISEKRIKDMGYNLNFVSTLKRIDWIKERYNPNKVIYIGDGIFDFLVMKEVGYSICIKDGDELALKYANYITSNKGGDRAIAECVRHIFKIFFNTKSIEDIIILKSQNNDKDS